MQRKLNDWFPYETQHWTEMGKICYPKSKLKGEKSWS